MISPGISMGHIGYRASVAGAVLAFCSIFATPLLAQQRSSLEGSWSGGGTVNLSSGATERARCRASFSRQSGNSFGMSAVCATSSARVAQTARIQQVGANQFAGDFHNSEYGVSGTIRITINANRLSASLSGGGGSAQLSLSR